MDAVTGGFSYTGGFILRELLRKGRRVRTLTNHPGRWEVVPDSVEVWPLQFRDEAKLVSALEGVSTLYSTYWIRFDHGSTGFERAIEDNLVLFDCARRAGVRKLVLISVSNCSLDSALPYYAGKAQVELGLQNSGLKWAIVRPTLIWGDHDILLNNIAWLLRRMPVFTIPGKGDYRVQPVSGEDVARTAVWAARQRTPVTVDAAGPEVMTYRELVERLAVAVGRRPPLVSLPDRLVIAAGRLVGWAMGDVLLTDEELEGLRQELLVSREPARGQDRLDDWLAAQGSQLGVRYSSELARHFDGPWASR